MKQAVLYARVSSREQEREGYSIPAQIKLLRAYAEKNDIEIVREFVEAESARKAGRAAFNEMVAYFKRSKSARIVLVEKTDRLYRNLRDAVTVEELDVEIHFVKNNRIVSKNAKSQDRFIHDIDLAMARNYSGNLSEEVRKGMREKCEQGMYPGHAPFGYRNNRSTRGVDAHPEKAPIVRRAFELYATGAHSLDTLRAQLRQEFACAITRSNLHVILSNRFYIGYFTWSGVEYRGVHEAIISRKLFDDVQKVLHGLNRGKYAAQPIAFRGMMHCAHDGCTVTGEFKKGKYTYYRCSGMRGKCELPRMNEAHVSQMLGDVLKGIEVPPEVAARIVEALKEDEHATVKEQDAQRRQVEANLEALRSRMSQAYCDKLDGKISEDFWARQMAAWQEEERRNEMTLEAMTQPKADRALNAARILELAQVAHSLYLTRNPAEQAELLRKVYWNCTTDGVTAYPTYRYPFDLIVKRGKSEEWSGRLDLNQRPPGPENLP